VKLKPLKLAPALIAFGVIVFVCLVRLLHLDFFERLECLTYDMRVREALKFPPAVATNLGFVDISNADIAFLKTNRSLGYRFGLQWPRQVYGRLLEELAAQQAQAVAFDVLFGELREDHSPVHLADDHLIDSDVFFALQMRRAGNVILSADQDLIPPDLFATNAMALGDITTDKDSDGILRRTRAFRPYVRWHWAFRQVAANPDLAIDLSKSRCEQSQVVLLRSNGDEIKVPLDSEGRFDLADFGGTNLPAGIPRKARPFNVERIWHMGIVLAARELDLDLSRAEVNLAEGRVLLSGKNGIRRIIPVDRNGYFYIDWCLPPNDPRLTQEPIRALLAQDKLRLEGQTNGLENHWAGKLAIVGSSATGNDLTDRGATPLQSDTLLASQHWNVANSVITGRFVRRTALATDLLLIVGMGILAALITWRLRALLAFLLVALAFAGYLALGNFLFVQHRYWLPLILPMLGALLMTHVCLVTWRVVFEQAEKRRVKSIFSRIVSPNIVNELLQAEKLSLGGARREVTVLFADVRGFTEFTDTSQEQAAACVTEQRLTGDAVEACFNEQARETLGTVNTYLGLVADMVKKHDKYIGDCVMAFWGAPTPNPQHALDCVRAALDAQRAVHELNRGRSEENRRREQENATRMAAGLAPRPLLPTLLLGSGINTGMATVGLMGSEAHLSNYTVFGREVNLASRLEGLSGRGRVLISETTYRQLQRDDPALAATCLALPDANVKGFRSAVKVYEVPWRLPEAPLAGQGPSPAGPADQPATPVFVPRDKD
jgi:class 3 adenylate cyclase/CHASE2 domain-containing sensor protein